MKATLVPQYTRCKQCLYQQNSLGDQLSRVLCVLFLTFLGKLIKIPLINVPLKYNRLVSPTALGCDDVSRFNIPIYSEERLRKSIDAAVAVDYNATAHGW